MVPRVHSYPSPDFPVANILHCLLLSKLRNWHHVSTLFSSKVKDLCEFHQQLASETVGGELDSRLKVWHLKVLEVVCMLWYEHCSVSVKPEASILDRIFMWFFFFWTFLYSTNIWYSLTRLIHVASFLLIAFVSFNLASDWKEWFFGLRIAQSLSSIPLKGNNHLFIYNKN